MILIVQAGWIFDENYIKIMILASSSFHILYLIFSILYQYYNFPPHILDLIMLNFLLLAACCVFKTTSLPIPTQIEETRDEYGVKEKDDGVEKWAGGVNFAAALPLDIS